MEESASPPPSIATESKTPKLVRRPRVAPPVMSTTSSAPPAWCAPCFRLPWIIAAIVVLAIALVVTTTTSSRRVQPWSAVFLTTGQVFFGHIARTSSDTFVLRDVYYLQVSTNLQTGRTTPTEPDLSLVKLGSELHGPKDEMRINREHILFTQDLRDDAPVVRVISREIADRASGNVRTEGPPGLPPVNAPAADGATEEPPINAPAAP